MKSKIYIIGVVLILAGSGVSYIREIKASVILPVNNREFSLKGITTSGGKLVDFGFSLALKSFEILRYKPDFAIYGPDNQLQRKARIANNGILDFSPYGKFREVSFIDSVNITGNSPQCTIHLLSGAKEDVVLVEGSARTESRALKNGYTLKMLKPVDKQYKAILRFTTDNGVITEKALAMNRPAEFKGWLFYFTSYDSQSFQYVVLTARRDPGRLMTIAGILILMAGVIVMFYLRGYGG